MFQSNKVSEIDQTEIEPGKMSRTNVSRDKERCDTAGVTSLEIERGLTIKKNKAQEKVKDKIDSMQQSGKNFVKITLPCKKKSQPPANRGNERKLSSGSDQIMLKEGDHASDLDSSDSSFDLGDETPRVLPKKPPLELPPIPEQAAENFPSMRLDSDEGSSGWGPNPNRNSKWYSSQGSYEEKKPAGFQRQCTKIGDNFGLKREPTKVLDVHISLGESSDEIPPTKTVDLTIRE